MLADAFLVELDTAYITAFRNALEWPASPRPAPRSEPLVPAFAVYYADWVWMGISRVILLDWNRASPMIVLCSKALIQYSRQDESINRHFETCKRENMPADMTSRDGSDSPRLRSLLRDLAKNLAAVQAKALIGQTPIIPLYW